MKLVTWNVNGVRAREAQLAELVAREQPDLLCLQEIKASPAQVPALLLEPAATVSGPRAAVTMRHSWSKVGWAKAGRSGQRSRRRCSATPE